MRCVLLYLVLSLIDVKFDGVWRKLQSCGLNWQVIILKTVRTDKGETSAGLLHPTFVSTAAGAELRVTIRAEEPKVFHSIIGITSIYVI